MLDGVFTTEHFCDIMVLILLNFGEKMEYRKTETNIKRMDRLKVTIALVLLEIVSITLFCIFGIVGTAKATDNNTRVITAEVVNHRYVDAKFGRTGSRHFLVYAGGESFKVPSGKNKEELLELFSSMPTVTVRLDRYGNVAELVADGRELCSLQDYNENQAVLRAWAIAVFSIAEALVLGGYAFYMIHHRTSKDKSFIGRFD
jgi:hypothetical protein